MVLFTDIYNQLPVGRVADTTALLLRISFLFAKILENN